MYAIPKSFPASAAVLLGCALIASCGLGPRRPAPPEAFSRIPDAHAPGPVLLLADSTWWSVRAEGDSNLLDRRAVSWYRVERRNPPVLEALVFRDDETTETPPAIRVDAYYPDGSQWSADGEGLPRTLARAPGILAGNGRERTVRVPGYREGALLRIETRRTVTRPAFRSLELLRGEHPCLSRWISFRYPASYDLRVGMENGEGLPVRADTVTAGGFREVRVAAQDLPPVQPFARQVYPEAWYAGLHFSVPPAGSRSLDWQGLGDYYLGMIAGSLAPDSAVGRAADGLAGADPDTLAERAFAYLQSRVRYLADEERLNAFIPRPPGRVLANGYGDCKEMANLMRALLREKGVGASLALTRSPAAPQLSEGYPSLADFNHMILCRRSGDGSLRWYDPTIPAAGAALSYLPLLSQKALLLAPGASRVDTIRPGPGFRNRAVTVSRLSSGPDGKWTLRGTVGLKGKAAFDLNQSLRHRHPGRDEARAAVKGFLADAFGIPAAEWDWSAPSPDSLEIAYAMPADGMLVTLGAGGVKLDVPSLMGMGPAGRNADFEGDRRYPAFEQDDLWLLPPGYRPLATREFRRGPAEGRWLPAAGGARRRFRCDGMVWKAGDGDALAGFQDALSEFTLASVWQ
jgi:hypothetical protein